MSKRPYLLDKIPVMFDHEQMVDFIEDHSDFSFCPYIAEKDSEAWDMSTSRVYMNQVLDGFLYLPVNIPKGDKTRLEKFFDYVASEQRVTAVNITQPHKSIPLIKERFAGNNEAINIDILLRDDSRQLRPYDLNSEAFYGWFEEEVESFESKRVVIIGAGGFGEPIAKKLARSKVSSLLLIDPVDKNSLAEQLNEAVPTRYQSSLPDKLTGESIVINAAGKEGTGQDNNLSKLLAANSEGDNVFVDVRPYLEIDIVEEAKRFGWRGYTGNGMNVRNDYQLLSGISEYLDKELIDYSDFKKLVDAAS